MYLAIVGCSRAGNNKQRDLTYNGLSGSGFGRGRGFRSVCEWRADWKSPREEQAKHGAQVGVVRLGRMDPPSCARLFLTKTLSSESKCLKNILSRTTPQPFGPDSWEEVGPTSRHPGGHPCGGPGCGGRYPAHTCLLQHLWWAGSGLEGWDLGSKVRSVLNGTFSC